MNTCGRNWRWSSGACAIGLSVVVAALAALAVAADAPRDGKRAAGSAPPRSTGPDVICSVIFNYRNWGEANDTVAFSVGTRSCNVGSMPVSWRDGTDAAPDNRHPVIAQNMYRLHDGRFEQIGQSWLKHGFCAVDGDDACAGCQDTNDCDILGVGCSDPYSATLNGFQPSLGPKWQVNPTNGHFPFPPDDPPWSGNIARRLQVASSDLTLLPTPRGGDARFFIEAHYIAGDEALFGNDLNNASYREVLLFKTQINGWAGDTVAEFPAIFAWQAADNAVQIVPIDVQNDGRFYVAWRVRPVGRSFAYEYAVLNYNADRAGHAFAVPVPASDAVSSIGFHDVDYHSGEPFDNADWIAARSDDELRWAGQPYAVNPNANALRWGTMYNFRFVSDRPPRPVSVRIELFKPHIVASVSVESVSPTPVEDINLDGTVGRDDLMLLIDAWSTGDTASDLNGDGIVDVFDLFALLNAWGS